jgi:glycosyltransferase involved in cell wall biosynthesis
MGTVARRMVSVAIPTLNGGADLHRVLSAVRAQTVEAELVVLDSGSVDGTRELAARHGAAVHHIDDFGHGRARNRLMELAAGDRVAFLTQDAVPASAQWLERLLQPEAALAYGPYAAPGDAPAPLRREYAELFGGLEKADGLRGAFASSANMCLRRDAWRAVPFRDVPYAEDQRLALDLAAAGYEKAYVPEAAVLHAHEYGPVERVRRWFDEFRALHEVHGFTAPASPRVLAGTVRAEVRRDRAFDPSAPVGASLAWHTGRVLGAALGTRSERIPAPIRERLSLERRR